MGHLRSSYYCHYFLDEKTDTSETQSNSLKVTKEVEQPNFKLLSVSL